MEYWRSLSAPTFLHSVQRLMPCLQAGDLSPSGSGVRAQAIDSGGTLLDDFHVVQEEHALHVCNAPSPAATASLAIGEHIANLAAQQLNL